jgi:hypothetical protein
MQLVPQGMDWTQMTRVERREVIHDIEEYSARQEQVEVPIREYFCNGIYAREMTVPAGALFVGDTHLTENLCVISKGVIKVATETGIELIESPCTFIAPPGTKRVGYALTETVWTVFHATTLTNTDDIRKHFVASGNQLENKL